MPLSRLDAMAKHQMQMMMAQSYIEGRKYWAENPDSEHGAPNEVQLVSYLFPLVIIQIIENSMGC